MQDPKVQSDAPLSRKARFLRHCKRTAFYTVVLFAVLVTAAAGSLYYMKGREVTAPDWLKTRLTAEIEKAVPEASIIFGDVVAVIENGWIPRFFVRDFRVGTNTGEHILTLSDVSAGLDLSALLERKISLSSLRANGVLLTLRRGEAGGFALFSGEETGAVVEEAPSVALMIAQLDEFFLTPQLENITEVDVQAITLRYEDRLSGRGWTIDGGRLRIDRNGLDLEAAADLAILGGTAGVGTVSANYRGVIGDTASDFGFQIENVDARDIASQSSAFGWLAALEAPISGALRSGLNSDGELLPLNAVLQIGPGVIQPTAEARPIPVEGALSYFTYNPKEQNLTFDVLEVDSKWGAGLLEGTASMATGKSGRIDQFIGQFRIEDMRLNPADLYPEPVLIESTELDVRLILDPFAMHFGRVDIEDAGQILSANGSVFVDEAGWKIAMDASMDGISSARVKELWPEQVKPKTRRWVHENVLSGDIKNASAALRLVQGERPNTYLSFDFENTEARFMRHMPHVQDGSGHASLVKERFVLVIDDGFVTAPQGGDVLVAGTSFIVPDTRVKPDPPGVVRLRADGGLEAALSLLDRPPLEVMKIAGLPVDLGSGQIELDGTISLPLQKGVPLSAIEFDVSGTATDVRTDLLLKDRDLASDRLAVQVSESEVRITGDVTMDGVPASITWSQQIGKPETPRPGQLTGQLDITPDALDTLGIALPRGLVRGSAEADFSVELEKGSPPRLQLTSDLRGIRLSIPEVNWGKSEQTDASLDLSATLGDQPNVDRIALSAPGLAAEGEVRLTENGQLDRLRMNRLRLGSWLNAPVDLVGRGAGRPIGVEVRGGRIDLRRANLGGGGGQGGPINVNLDELQVSDTIAINNLRGGFTTNGGLSGNFDGLVNGQAAVSGQITPSGGRSAIRIQGRDAGDVFAAAGLLSQARGGVVDLELLPIGPDGAFDGKLRIRNTRITDAPAMAALLNAISVVGLIDELNGDGIRFSSIDADFRLTPSRITLREASAVGASMGLSMDGVFVPDTGALQMQGVISPVYALNAIGSILTRPGEGLIGFNYSITGTAKNPQVFVNPLTALAPGMLRNLFRRSLPDVPLEEGEVAKPKRKPPDLSRHQER